MSQSKVGVRMERIRKKTDLNPVSSLAGGSKIKIKFYKKSYILLKKVIFLPPEFEN